ncbi:MAG: alkaline phosphatase family protein, partial [Bacteroidota bacterium]
MPDTPRPDASHRLAKKVLLIGWDAADWKVITPLLDAGKMPALESLIDRGVMGNLATLDPPLSPMLWTSIATGKTADQHGILGFVQPSEDGTRIQPVLGTTRKCKAVWNILNQEGLRSNVVGWWPSHPAEPINGAMVSNFYQKATRPAHRPWPLSDGTVHPLELADTLASLRVHPAELTAAHILPFVPALAEVDQDKDKRLRSLANIIAHAASIQSAATYILEHVAWDFAAVYFDAIDHFGHGFMKYHPPKLPIVSEADYRLYREVIEAGYRFHDMLLGRLLDFTDEDTVVMLISDHGFHSDHLRPLTLPKSEPAAPALEHRDFGIITMAGPGIKHDDRIYGASLLDITPTLLTMFGLPVGSDMRGRPLVEAFEEAPPIRAISSWETVTGDAGCHATGNGLDPWAEREVMQQLVELGYVEEHDEPEQKRMERAADEAQYFLARVYLSTGRKSEALPILEALHAKDPNQEHLGQRLTSCYLDLGRPADARRIVESFIEQYESRENETADSSATKAPIAFAYLEGCLLLAEGKAEQALVRFREAEQADPHYPVLHRRLGQTYLKMQDWRGAERAYRKALTIAP